MDYRRAVVVDAGPKDMTNTDALRSEGTSAFKKSLPEPTLLVMSGLCVNQDSATVASVDALSIAFSSLPLLYSGASR